MADLSLLFVAAVGAFIAALQLYRFAHITSRVVLLGLDALESGSGDTSGDVSTLNMEGRRLDGGTEAGTDGQAIRL